MVGGGEFSTMYTYREIIFCDLFDGLPFCIIITAPVVSMKSPLFPEGAASCN
jgi:hypothetical protein